MGRLYIRAELRNNRTVISDSYFTPPFKIAKPFYRGEFCEIMIMQASAGILDGDRHEIEIDIKSGAHVMVTGQSYTKLFKMDSVGARQNVVIRVESGAELLYMPCPVIPFAGSKFIGRNEIYLKPGAKFVIRDIFASGRIAMNESFEFTSYRSRTEVRENERIIFCDNTRLIPSEMPLKDIGFFEGKTHMGTVYFYGYDRQCFDAVPRDLGVTSARGGILVRGLSYSADMLEKQFETVIFKAVKGDKE